MRQIISLLFLFIIPLAQYGQYWFNQNMECDSVIFKNEPFLINGDTLLKNSYSTFFYWDKSLQFNDTIKNLQLITRYCYISSEPREYSYLTQDSILVQHGQLLNQKSNGLTIQHIYLPQENRTIYVNEIPYKMGIIHGVAKKYTINSLHIAQLFDIRFYENGKLNGPHLLLNETGGVSMISNNRHDDLKGWRTEITSDTTFTLYKNHSRRGNTLIKSYENGKLISRNMKSDGIQFKLLKVIDCKCYFRVRKPFVHPKKGIQW